MTPGLAGFTVDGSGTDGNDQQTWDEIVDGVLAAVSAEFTPVPERGTSPASGPGTAGARQDGGPRRRTWLDTFDWRLHKASLTLQYCPASRGGELRLSDGATETIQPVASWQASRPHLLPDLPDGPVAARVGGLIAPRALLPVALTSAQTTGYRLVNEDGKTVVRLLLERQRLAGPQQGQGQGQSQGKGQQAEITPRITLVEVRGYQPEARRAQALIAAVPGVRPAASTPLEDALRALGRRPGDYTNKVEAEITAAMPASRAVATVLLYLLDAIDANIPGVLADIDSEFLHDLRVAVRRTRSALKLFGDALTGLPGRTGLTDEQREFFAAEFKWVGDLTTPTRDLDVQLLDFEGTAQGLAAAKPDDLEPFRAYLEQRRRKEFRSLNRGLKSARFTELISSWRTQLTGLLASESNGKAARASRPRDGRIAKATPKTAGLLAGERTRAAFNKVAKRGAAITQEAPAESLHDLRKRCKELRYSLEFFAPLHDRAAYAKVVGDLKRLQDCLGDFQDSEVQIGEIRALAADMLASGETETPAVTLLAMGEVTAGLAVRQRAARADFERRFAAFADAAGQRRMAALLSGQELRGRE
jgi:CHAD domain-containing protein